MPTTRPRPNRILFLIPVLLLVCGLAAAGYWLTRDRYVVYAGDEVHVVSGDYDSVGEVLAAAGVNVRDEDMVTPPLSAAVEPGTAIQIQRAHSITVHTESGRQTWWTLQTQLGPFLSEAGITIQRTDQLFADGQRVPFSALDETPLPAVLEIGQFVNVIIHDGANEMRRRTAAQTVGQALQEAGLNLYAADGVEPPLGSWLSPDQHIYVRRSMPLTIAVDGRVVQTRSHHSNALDVLAEAGIGLVGQDFTRPGPETVLQPNGIIEVIRVTEDFRVEDQPIPYETLWQATDQLELDQRALLSPGVPGILRRRLRVRYENGAEVSQTPDGEWVAQEPVNEVIGYGTRIVIRVLPTPGGAYEYWRVVRMRVTAYTAASSGKPPDHPAYGVTASGVQAGTGIVAVDPAVVPFRSWVYVPGYGIGYAGDTGGGVQGRWIDLGYSEDDFVSWSGYVDVYYLTPVPPPEKINYLIPTWLP